MIRGFDRKKQTCRTFDVIKKKGLVTVGVRIMYNSKYDFSEGVVPVVDKRLYQMCWHLGVTDIYMIFRDKRPMFFGILPAYLLLPFITIGAGIKCLLQLIILCVAYVIGVTGMLIQTATSWISERLLSLETFLHDKGVRTTFKVRI